MKEQVEIERVLASSEKALVYANKEKWKYKDKCVELEKLLKECKTPINLLIKMNIDGINGYELLDLLIKIDNAIGGK